MYINENKTKIIVLNNDGSHELFLLIPTGEAMAGRVAGHVLVKVATNPVQGGTLKKPRGRPKGYKVKKKHAKPKPAPQPLEDIDEDETILDTSRLSKVQKYKCSYGHAFRSIKNPEICLVFDCGAACWKVDDEGKAI